MKNPYLRIVAVDMNAKTMQFFAFINMYKWGYLMKKTSTKMMYKTFFAFPKTSLSTSTSKIYLAFVLH